MTRRAYLASRYQEHPTMRWWRDGLRNFGIAVTARWIDGGHDIRDVSGDAAAALRHRFAVEDIEDIVAADALVCFSPAKHHGTGRGGRHVEVGLAIALHKPIIMLGERENVFHHLDGVVALPEHASVAELASAIRSAPLVVRYWTAP